MTMSHCVPSNKVNRNALCSAGTNRMQAIRMAENTKEKISQGLIPYARTQIGSVLERWLKARSICEKASTQNAIV